MNWVDDDFYILSDDEKYIEVWLDDIDVELFYNIPDPEQVRNIKNSQVTGFSVSEEKLFLVLKDTEEPLKIKGSGVAVFCNLYPKEE